MSLRRITPLLVLLCTACASGGGSALFRRDLGNASGPDAVAVALRVAQQYSYQIANVDSLRGIRIETEWLKRKPFSDEEAFGIEDAETRLLIVARPRGTTLIGNNYSVNLTVENRLRVQGSSAWNESLNTDMFNAYAGKIAAELKQLYTNIGVRKY
jgi:hypothetical protein